METSTLNVLQLSFSFFLVFTAYSSAAFISEVLLDQYAEKGELSKHAGYHSQAIIYVVFTFSNFFAAPILNKIGTKASLIVGASTYFMFYAGFLFMNEYLIYILSGVLGIGAAIIWTAQGKYLSLNSNEANSSKHSGLSWAIFQMCLICGGIFLFILFEESDVDFKDVTKNVMFLLFAGITFLGIVIMALLRKVEDVLHVTDTVPVPQGLTTNQSTMDIASSDQVVADPDGHVEIVGTGVNEISDEVINDMASNGSDVVELGPGDESTLYERFVQTIRLAKSSRIRFPIILFMFSGITQSFYGGIYPSMIGYSGGFGPNPKRNLALNMICYGIGQTFGGLLFGICSDKTKKLGRDRIALIGTIVDFVAFSLIFVNFAEDSPYQKTHADGIITPSLPLALFCGFLLGCGDSFWNTQIYSLLITSFSDCSAEAFSIFKFFQSLICAIGFFIAKWFTVKVHLLILVISAVISTASFILIEAYIKQKSEIEAIETEEMNPNEGAVL
ncbi:unnamed protein product [Bursaphelenchus okinawaensis]|uniref:UNC93-like protein MFSD11 n=1 Tax=Bursaphelenchus okinawaensis TaxID=465554 RepID=A0A811LNI2_9BILA|nr:unnamed protein product [Bursaphelenchus okinawaensis]CAG9127282.1 unnamed protein product [Bursaphelenchus okinawaensis]